MSARIADHDVAGQTVLVTGGAGFIGSHLAEALLDDNEVRILDDLSTGRLANVPAGATLIVGDLLDDDRRAAAMADVDLVFHEAAQVSVARSVAHPRETDRTNATGTLAMLEAARREDARVVCASSAAIYGPPAGVPIAETDPKQPQSPYGVSKLAADQYTRRYADLYGLPTVALRYFNVYGPRQPAGEHSGVVATFREQARAGEPITVAGDGEQTRDFVHVSDVVRANLRAATTPTVGRAFNVGTGETVTIAALADLIRSSMDSSSSIQFVEAREGDIRHSLADTTAASAALGFEASVALEDGLATLSPTIQP